MKRPLILTLMMMGCLLSSCSVGKFAKTDGIIDCYSILVTSGGDMVYNATYSQINSPVYEYQNDDGKSIYLDYDIQSDEPGAKKVPVRFFKNRYQTDYEQYNYVGFVGWLTQEENYYYDTDDRIIDKEIKWSEYKFQENPDKEPADNKKAYSCAKKNYYHVKDTTRYYYELRDFVGYTIDDEEYFYKITDDVIVKGLEIHTYLSLAEDNAVGYVAKWF